MLDELRNAARRVGADRALRRLLDDCQRLLSERGEANSLSIARELVDHLDALPEDRQPAFFDHLANDFSPDPQRVLACAQAYADSPGADELIALTSAAEPLRQELFRRINQVPGGTAALLRLRRALLAGLKDHPGWKALESDLAHLLSSWFNPGFLQLQRVDWNSPARLLEQLIELEAVHEIDGWDDLRRRLLPDRRLFAFFHPQLPETPLIFVEVALLPDMPGAIGPLIHKTTKALPPEQFKVATFYSISNCEPGLRGVSLGNFLIKRVAEELQRELPQLMRFVTLSPIPGFSRWLGAQTAESLQALPGIKRDTAAALQAAHGSVLAACHNDLAKLQHSAALQALPAPASDALLALCAAYLRYQSPTPQGDPVARFHLGNGARLERLNPLGDLSRKGLKQSHGLMVNYLYKLPRVEANHQKFSQGQVAHSPAVASLGS